jgi:glycerol-1-phosphate dehydrogenase [NAD(P)+]
MTISIKGLINKYNIPIKEVLLESDIISRLDLLIVNQGFQDKNILLVSDQNLRTIYQKVSNSITSNNISSLVLENPNADDITMATVEKRCVDADLVIAVGSGTINDLCKISSYNNNIPYIVVATAPSMNGYASANASITIDGHKKSLMAHQAKAIYFDLDIISKAPERMIKAGIGDSMCYYTCYFDWLLSSLILKTNFNNEVFEVIKPYQDELMNYGGHFRDVEFSKIICELLIVSGFAMYLCKGSYPASQGEHLISHFLEMKYPDIAKRYLHGQQIAVTTLTMIDIQINLLKEGAFNFKDQNPTLSSCEAIFNGNKDIASDCLKSVNSKRVSKDDLQEVNDNFNGIKKKLEENMISKEWLLKFYDKFNLMREFENLKGDDVKYLEAVYNAYLIRDRLTALDFRIVDIYS